MFEIAALDHGCPLHFICMFILPARGPLFMDNWRTQIIIPLQWKICFYHLQSFAMSLCTLTPPSDCLFIITAFLLSQWGSGQVQKGAKPFPALFLSVTSLCIPLKHTDPCLVCSLGGTHHTQNEGLNTRCTCLDCDLLDAPQRALLVVDRVASPAWIVASFLTTSMMKRWPCNGFAFSAEICNLPT